MAGQSEHITGMPSTSTFSFSAPFPPVAPSSSAATALKQRRVSLALPSSPRHFASWSFRDDTGLGVHTADATGTDAEKKGKMRRIEGSGERQEDEPLSVPQTEKKPRKKWTQEETDMLVKGCNKWGVGNWKSILNDTEFKFDNRSPVDLKDRFRTYFPDAYKQHYPNAKTHLSSKVRSSHPDGTSIFEKTRSKKRRPFTEEEDRALKAGYDKHGTVWATIVKDPIFQEQNRRSTDLRDRFRNAFPDLYQAAGYKPRTTVKKNKKGDPPHPMRAATDDQLASSSALGPVRRKRRHTTQGLYRGGTKSVPESTTCSEDEDEDNSDGEDEPRSSSGVQESLHSVPSEEMTPASDLFTTEIDMHDQHDPLASFIPSSSLSEMTDSSQPQAWPSTLDTPLNVGTWSSAANVASPTSSQLSSDYFLHNSPFYRRGECTTTMIGKSAWGSQDWLSANPRLDPSAASSSSSSYVGGISPAPSSPFSFAQLSHGVLDRYDLFPPSLAHDFASEAGIGDTHSTFSDPDMFPTSSFRGFTHHSDYAGDLIFGMRTHQPPQSSDYGPGFGFGSAGLGLSGVQHSSAAGMHPMQLHTPALPGIDEIELTSITLDDHLELDLQNPMDETLDTAMPKDDTAGSMNIPDLSAFALSQQSIDDLVGIPPQEINATPPGTPHTSRSLRQHHPGDHGSGSHNRSVSVPPSEHRFALPRTAQTQLLKSRPLLTPPRSLSLMDLVPTQPAQPDVFNSHPSSYPTEGWPRQQGDMYDLPPFLDLHYYAPANGGQLTGVPDPSAPSSFAKAGVDMDLARQGQALDLADSYTSASRNLGLPPSLTQHIPMLSQSASSTPPVTGRMYPMHHRGQSVVSPQDLLLPKVSDNKRKRSSWDGGVL